MNEKFLITTSYRGKNRTIIWELQVNEQGLSLNKKKCLQIYDNNFLPIVYDHAAWGISQIENNYILAEANGIRITDENFDELKRYQNEKILRDLHDLNYINGNIYVANTLSDKIEIFSNDLIHKQTISLLSLPGLKNKHTISKRNPTTISNSFHINFIYYHNNKIYVTLSFVNKKKYLSKKFPFLKPTGRQSPGLIYNLSDKNVFISNLKGAHDGVWFNNQLWVHQTHNMSLDIFNSNGKLVQSHLYNDPGIYRGLAISERNIIVGKTKFDFQRSKASKIYSKLIKKRNGTYRENSQILILNKQDFNIKKEINLPDYDNISPEIYKIIRIE